jgi:hypothetical protein
MSVEINFYFLLLHLHLQLSVGKSDVVQISLLDRQLLFQSFLLLLWLLKGSVYLGNEEF